METASMDNVKKSTAGMVGGAAAALVGIVVAGAIATGMIGCDQNTSKTKTTTKKTEETPSGTTTTTETHEKKVETDKK